MTDEPLARGALARALATVRNRTVALARPLTPEDAQAQAMEDASPAKWHLAHTTWFFHAFVLAPRGLSPSAPDQADRLFNSYYEALGPRHPRPQRGVITRPGLDEVLGWRAAVDDALQRFCRTARAADFQTVAPLLALGCAHEEQHQELLLTDILALFARHPSCPAYEPTPLEDAASESPRLGWRTFDGGLVTIGAEADGFAFDCERPRAKVWLEPYALADRPVTNGEWLAFMADGGYRTAGLWLSDGWACVQARGWVAPGYWREVDGGWSHATLRGLAPLHPAAPVSGVSHWEADAYARWAGRRLPSEAEWEHAAAGAEATLVNDLASGRLTPAPTRAGVDQMFGDVWEWTASAFLPHRGFQPAAGAVGEYNGKFMAGQMVLKGGSCLTPRGHVRASYRNFFYPHQRWQMMGVRLAGEP